MLSIILLLVVFLNLLLGLFVISQNRKSWDNRLFFLLSFFAAIWTLTNYLTGVYPTPFWLQSTYAFGALVISTGLIWILFLTDKFLNKKKVALILFIALFFFFSSYWNGFIAKEYEKIYLGGAFIGEPGIGLAIYTLFFLAGAVLILYKLFSTQRKEDDEKVKKRLLYIFFGALVTLIISFLTSLILPLFSIFSFTGLDSIGFLVFLSFIAYAITKHGLFNIRVIATELLIFALWVIFLVRFLMADDLQQRMVEGGFLLAITIFGFWIIKSVLDEVKRREEIEKISKELETANARLQELDRIKTEFLSFATHQIKAPLTAVKGFASLIGDNSYGAVPGKVKEISQRIIKAANRLVDLVDNILNLGRIESGRMEYDFEEIDFVKLVAEVVDDMKMEASEKKLELLFELEGIKQGEPLKIKADAQKLRQVVQNLIDNAIKYTPEGFVRVAIKNEGPSVLLSVLDTGVGILPELMPHLFQKFVRETGPGEMIQGTGLGLYIAKEIIKAHQGEIWAESEGRGFGSQFFVRVGRV